MFNDKRIRPILLAMMVICGAGCQSTTSRCLHQRPLPPESAVELDPGIILGGFVRNPGLMPYQEGITIDQAISYAGGFAPIRNNQFEFEYLRAFVCLSRGTGLENQRIYIPLNYVEQSAAGEIQLSPNDNLKIVDVQQTGLNENLHKEKSDRRTRNGVAVAGMVNQPTAFFTEIPDTFSKLLNNTEVGVQLKSDVVLLRRGRPNCAGNKDLFIIPRSRKELVNKSRSTFQPSTPVFSQERPEDLNPNTGITSTNSQRSDSDLEAAMQADNRGSQDEPSTNETPNDTAAEETRQSTLGEIRDPMNMSILRGDEIVFTNLVAIPTVYRGLTEPVTRRLKKRKAAMQANRTAVKSRIFAAQQQQPGTWINRLRTRFNLDSLTNLTN